MGYDKDPTLITLRLVLRAEEIIETGWLLHVRLENDELSPRNATIIVVKCPFTTKDAERLRWYLEDYPTVDPLDTARADTASRSVADYGRALSKSLFVDEVLRWFESVVQPVALQIVIEASTQATTIFSLHWEILEDTSLWLSSHPSSFQQKLLRVGVWRKLKTPGAHCTTIHFPITNDAPAFRILLVVARSNVFTDIGHRTISRPLIEIIETISSSDQSVMVEIVRPGTWEALENCLQIHPPGYYHVVHFDMHGRFDVKTSKHCPFHTVADVL